MAYKKMPPSRVRQRLSYKRFTYILGAATVEEAAMRAYYVMDKMSAFRSIQSSEYAKDSLRLAIEDRKKPVRRIIRGLMHFSK